MHLKLSKGHDFNLNSYPSDEIVDLKDPNQVLIHPLDFPYINPKLLVSQGDEVKVGSPIFFDKFLH